MLIEDWTSLKSSPRYYNTDCVSDPSSDYYNSTNFCIPEDGKGYVALVYDRTFAQNRDYLQVELNSKMTKGNAYLLSYYMTIPLYNETPISDYGVFFSDTLIEEDVVSGYPFEQILLAPQIEMDTIPNLVYSEAGTWQRFTYCFIADEDYSVLTFGIFEDMDSIKGVGNVSHTHTLYAYDNMFLTKLDTVPRLEPYKETICVGECIVISSNQSLVAYDFVWDLPGSDIGSSTDSIVTVCYDTPGVYDIGLEVEHCVGRYDRFFEHAVTVVTPVAMLPLSDTVICEGEDVVKDIANEYTVVWSDGSIDNHKSFSLEGNYTYTISNGYCEETWDFDISYHIEAQYQEAHIFACDGDHSSFLGILYDEPGTYHDTIYSQQGCDSLYYVIRFDFFMENAVVVDGEKGFCEGSSTSLKLISPHTLVKWGDNASDNPRIVNKEGQYILYTKDENLCQRIDTYNIVSYPTPSVTTEDMIDVWYYKGIPLIVDYEGEIDMYNWKDDKYLDCGDCDFPSLISPHEGTYNILVTNQYGCTDEDVIIVRFKTAKIYLPTVISRNPLDEVNGYFFVQSDVDIIYDLTIYDRWGGRMYHKKDLQSNNQDDGWLPESNNMTGVYVYEIQYKENGKSNTIIGDITLL